MLSQDFFKNNRIRLQKLAGNGLIVITANGLMQRSGDTVYPFRQDSNFYYLTGLNEPDLLLVLDGKNGDEFHILPEKTDAEEVFGGSIDSRIIAEISGVRKAMSYREGWAHLKQLQRSRKKIHTILAPPTKVTHTDSFFTNGNRRRLIEKLNRIKSTTTFLDIRTELTALRQIKQPEEIAAIKRAIIITAEGITQAKRRVKDGVTGYQLKAELDHIFSVHGVEHGFTPVIMSGKDTCVIHSSNLSGKVRLGEPVMFDIGAESELYSADISRTFFHPKPNKRQTEVHEAVMRVHSYALKFVKPGIKWRDYVIQVDYKMGEELIKLGLMTENTRQNVRVYFPHAVSHSLGLDVHDVCDYTTIQENMVITVEPGIYIPEEALGVRIEDDILVTKNGAVNLSAHISYE